jgi:hypothetical protein
MQPAPDHHGEESLLVREALVTGADRTAGLACNARDGDLLVVIAGQQATARLTEQKRSLLPQPVLDTMLGAMKDATGDVRRKFPRNLFLHFHHILRGCFKLFRIRIRILFLNADLE